MKLLILAPSTYMSLAFHEVIYAPKELAISLVNGLVSKGHQVTFATAPDVETKATLLPGDQAYIDLISHTATTGQQQLIKRDYEIDLIMKAAAEVKRGKYDLVHVYAKDIVHYFDPLFDPVPTVYTLHDPARPAGTLGYIVYNKFKSHRFVAISSSQKRAYEGCNVVDTVYHGIDTNLYPFQMHADNGYIFLGRLVAEKGLEDAIKACVVTNEKLLIGSHFPKHGEESEYYKTAVAPMLDDPKIEEVGMVTDRAKADLLGRSKALLFPIKWEEPFGMVMIEAIACGTPVIAYNRGSVPEIIKDGVTGFIINPPQAANVTNVSNSSNLVIKKSGIEGFIEAINRIGEIDRAACRRHVEENFSVEKMVEGYERVYKKTL